MNNSLHLFSLVLTSAILMLLTGDISSQETINSPFRKYATQSYNRNILSANNEFRENLISLEDSINNFHFYGTITNKVIPVVFHVLQSPGMPYISDSTIIRQLNQLNFDYNNSSTIGFPLDSSLAQYESHALIPQIYFCLTDTIGGIPIEDYIIRTNISTPFFQVANEMKSRDGDGSDPVMPENCINIWICNLPDSIAGFSQLPGGPVGTDGIVISYKYLIPSASALNSTDYNRGKTLTHLVASYLGVYELWNEENPCYDDYVYDTPIHNEPNHGFEIYYTHYSICPGNEVEMIINFMDNAVDSLAIMFTKGQVYRMHSVLNSLDFRGNLSNNTIACSDSVFSSNDSIFNPIAPLLEEDQFKVYPNPANNSITLDIKIKKQTSVNFFLYDVRGIVLRNENWIEPGTIYSKVIDVSNIQQGIYYLCLYTANEFSVFPITILN